MKISDLAPTQEFTIPTSGGVVKYSVRGMLTWLEMVEYDKILKDCRDKKKDEVDVGKFFLGKLIVDWNLEDEDGKPLPVTEDAMLKLPADIVIPMALKIKEMIDGSHSGHSVKKKNWLRGLLRF